jgi:hypothetical protein
MPFDERTQFAYLLNDHALFFQGAFALHEAGTLEKETYEAYLNWFACNLLTRGGSAWWAEIGRQFYPPRMVQAVEIRLDRGGLPNILDLPMIRLSEHRSPARELKGERTES